MKSLPVLVLAVLALVSACRAQNSPTGDELNAKIKPLTDDQLIDCLKEKPTNCPLKGLYLDRAWIKGELAARRHPDALIAAYRTEAPEDRSDLVEALWSIDDPKVLAFMHSIAFERLSSGQDSGETFFPLDYLARRCDQRALARLNRRVNFDKSFPMGCIDFAPTVAAFGRCNYRAAAPNLVRSLHAACLNITDAALDGLQKFFPHSCKQAHSIEELQSCYEDLVQKDPALSEANNP